MYKYCTWVWFSASRQLQLVLLEDLGATVTFSGFAALSPRGPEQLLYCIQGHARSHGALGWESLSFFCEAQSLYVRIKYSSD